MNATKKITSKTALSYVLTNCELPEDIGAKLTAMLEALEKKSGAEKKLTPTQEENLKYKAIIEANLAVDPETISDLTKRVAELNGLTPQKISPIINALVAEGKATKSTIKGRSYFSK